MKELIWFLIGNASMGVYVVLFINYLKKHGYIISTATEKLKKELKSNE